MADEEEPRYFLNPESVSQHLYCSICQEVFSEPQRARCGHSFCKRCIHSWLQKSKTCPEDRKPVFPDQLHRDFILENIIGDQQVACPFRTKGCSHIGPLELLKGHKQSCIFNPSNLPDFMNNDPASNKRKRTKSSSEEETDGAVPALGKPSLKMRLFSASERNRKILCSMFKSRDRSKT